MAVIVGALFISFFMINIIVMLNQIIKTSSECSSSYLLGLFLVFYSWKLDLDVSVCLKNIIRTSNYSRKKKVIL